MPAHTQGCPSGPVWWELGDVAFMIHDEATAAQGLRAGYEAINLELRFSGMLQPERKGSKGLWGLGAGGPCRAAQGMQARQRALVKLEPLEIVVLLLSSSTPAELPPLNVACCVHLFHT